MQSFLAVRTELAAERSVPEEVVQTLKERGWPKIASATKVPLRARIDPRAVTMAAGAVLLGWLAVVERGRR